MNTFHQLIRTVPDFPRPGIQFRDITPALEDPRSFREVVDALAQRYAGKGITKVGGIESRGFILGSALAYALGSGLVVFRKPGKLPRPTRHASYSLEYGESTLHVHHDALSGSDRVVLVDDLIATGGTLAAAARLTLDSGATLVEAAAIIELLGLNGRQAMPAGVTVHSLLVF